MCMHKQVDIPDELVSPGYAAIRAYTNKSLNKYLDRSLINVRFAAAPSSYLRVPM